MVLDELVVLVTQDDGSLSCRVNPTEVSGPRPCARSGATLLQYEAGKVLLYGGFGADGKPLDDAYLLDTAALKWSKVYNGHPDLVGQEGASAGVRELHASVESTVPMLPETL